MQKLKGFLDVTFINKTFFPKYFDVAVINYGECFIWAYVAYRLYPNLELWDMEAHAFVRSKVTGKFYDSESPNGVDDWKDLPATNFGKGCGCFSCQEPAKKYRSVETFCDAWKEQRKRFNVDFQKIDQQIERALKSKVTAISVSHGWKNFPLQRPVVRQVRSP